MIEPLLTKKIRGWGWGDSSDGAGKVESRGSDSRDYWAGQAGIMALLKS